MKLTNSKIFFLLRKMQLIKYPLKSEKSQQLNRVNKVTLIVHKSLTKLDLFQLFNFLLPNQIKTINLITLPLKKKKVRRFKSFVFSNNRRAYKKAYITLNQSIYSSLFFKSVCSDLIEEENVQINLL